MLVDLIVLLLFHYIGDFLLQEGFIRRNKSSNMVALSFPVVIYTIVIMMYPATIGNLLNVGEYAKFTLYNGTIHFIVDFITAKITKSLYNKGHIRIMMDVVGLDQTIHICTLIYLYFDFLT